MNTDNFVVFRNLFGVTINVNDYDTEQNIQKRKASYKEIQKWVRDRYGEHVTNLDISPKIFRVRVRFNISVIIT